MLEPRSVWAEAFSWQPGANRRVLPSTIAFGAFATFIYLLYRYRYPNLILEVGPHEVAGVLLSLLLVFRTNAGYERWWEGRKLWGGIVNQARNLALMGLAHGPADERWREQLIRWTAAFAWTAKARLRGETVVPELVALLGEKETARVQAGEHMPLCVALRIDELLRQACQGENGLDRFAFLQAERERAGLIDHLGGCERIRSTPLASVYSVTIRRFILFYLATLPFALLHKFDVEWLAPVVTVLVAHPVLVLDQLGIELQQPFDRRSLNHLPLEDICRNIEKNLLALFQQMSHGAYSAAESDGEASDVVA
ncbi:MAG TPA: bestrophin family ion channel [Gemmataceae bacterium]|nr:bestrophin family ion channel [Gemmataceae bacterium]